MSKGGDATSRTRRSSAVLFVERDLGVLLISDPQRFSMLENRGAVTWLDALTASAMDSRNAFWFVRNASMKSVVLACIPTQKYMQEKCASADSRLTFRNRPPTLVR